MRTPVGLALDVGGTTVRAGVFRASGGDALIRDAVVTADRDYGLRAVRSMAETMCRRAREDGLDVVAIGAGFPEYVDLSGQLTSREVLDWTIQPEILLEDLAERIRIESDVRCGAMGERDASGIDDFLYVSWGTGLSHTLVLDGRPWAGVRGEAIAFGELPVLADPAHNLEGFASGSGIAGRYRERTSRQSFDGAREVVRLALAGDRDAQVVLSSAAAAMGQALGWVVGILDPGTVVIGGGLGSAVAEIPDLRDPLIEEYRAAVERRPCAPALHFCSAGPDAGLRGAAILAQADVGRARDEGGIRKRG